MLRNATDVILDKSIKKDKIVAFSRKKILTSFKKNIIPFLLEDRNASLFAYSMVKLTDHLGS